MKLALILTVPARDDVLDAQLSYHLAAGVDVVLVAGVENALGSIRRAGVVVVELDPTLTELVVREQLARRAFVEHGADWVIDSDVGEFWWPRAESLGDALVAIPPRYTVVQALVRTFLSREDDGPRAERTELGSPLQGSLAPGEWLRPIYRADAALTLVPRGAVAEPWRVPLRAWYPIEVFRYPERAEAPWPSARIVSDTRLVDALARLRSTGELAIAAPDIVDDAAYAVECAALGEADFGPIEAHIADLELRIAALEAKFWPSVQRALRRLVPRRR
jgi:hypothetical protein